MAVRKIRWFVKAQIGVLLLPAGLLLAALIGVQMVWVLGAKETAAGLTATTHAADYSNTKELGRVLYTDYRHGGFVYKMTQHGPFMSLAYHW